MSTPTTTLCPGCGVPLTGAPACPACRLQLAGPSAGRLWQVDQRLASLDAERLGLSAERGQLLALLRSGAAPLTWEPQAAGSARSQPVVLPRESSPKQVQNTLLGLGALLLALAGVVFAAVTYQSLGATGRALVLLTLTGLAAGAPAALLRRGLTASAEAVGSVAVVLAMLTVGALRRAGLGADTELSGYLAVSSAVLAVALAAWAFAVPLRTGRLAALIVAQAPVVLVLIRLEVSPAAAAVALTALAAVDLLVTLSPAPKDVRVAATGLCATVAGAALLISAVAVVDDDRGAVAGLLGLAVLAVGAGVVRARQREVLTGLAVPLVAAAAWAAVRPSLTAPQEPLVAVAVALVALQVALLLPHPRRSGPVWGSLTVIGVALLAVAEPVLTALVGPITWLAHPWSFTGTDARDAVLVGERWDGTVVTLVVLAAAALGTICAGVALDRIRQAAMPAAALGGLSAVVLPLGLATSYPVALALLLGLGIACCAAGLLRPEPLRTVACGTGFAVALLAAAWSTADQDATLLVLPVVAVLAAVTSLRLPVLTSAAALLAGAELAAYGASRDLAPDQVGGLLLVAPAVCVALSYLVTGTRRVALEVAGAVLAATAVVLAVDDPGWLSWTLAVSGLLGLAVAIRPDRREVGLAGGLLLSASSWVRLADAGVQAPEPYVAPLAAAALLFGYLRRRENPATSSFAAYGAGLSVALVPSLLKALGDPTPTRGLLLLVVCLGVVLLGVKDRLRAPLAIGGMVLAVDGLHLLAPYAAALPRWTLLAATGAALVLVGATYEQRRRDVTRLRERFDDLG